MAKHVGMDPAKLGALADAADQIVDTLTGELPTPLGDEQPGQSRVPDPQVAPDRPQLFPVDRMMRREATLQSVDPDAHRLQVQGGDGEPAKLCLAQLVAIHQQHHQVISDAVPAGLGRLKKTRHFRLGEEVLGLLVQIDGFGSGHQGSLCNLTPIRQPDLAAVTR